MSPRHTHGDRPRTPQQHGPDTGPVYRVQPKPPTGPQTAEVQRAANPTRECQWTMTVRKGEQIVFFHVYQKREHAEEAADAYLRGVRL